MAITPINPKAPKKDTMDKILQGLQIANSVFKIPVDIAEMRKYNAEADIKQDEREGIVSAETAAKSGRALSLLPKSEAPALTPPADGAPSLIPTPTEPKADDYYGPTRQKVKTRQGGEVVDAYLEPSADERSKFFSSEADLHKQWRSDPTTVATKEMYRSGKALLDLFSKKKVLGPDDLAGVFKFIQTVEPGSFVREGEAQAAQQAAGLKSQLNNILDKLKSGTKFDEAARKNMMLTVRGLMGTQLGLQSKIDARYESRAKQQGFKPENIVIPEYDSPAKAKPRKVVNGKTYEDNGKEWVEVQ